MILAVTFAIHCTDLLDRWAGPGTLDWVMVTPPVQAVVACCCLVLFMNSIYVLGQFTCCCKFCMGTSRVLPAPTSTPTPPARQMMWMVSHARSKCALGLKTSRSLAFTLLPPPHLPITLTQLPQGERLSAAGSWGGVARGK